MVEKVVIIGSGPAGWTAAIYAARANLHPLVFEGAINAANAVQGTLPLGQLNLTTEVENYPGTPSGDTRAYLASALKKDRLPYWVQANKAQPSHGINGPELMELMRQQAVNFSTRIITDDIIKVDFKRRPFRLYALGGEIVETKAVIIATGARANYLGLPSEDRYKNNGVSACAVCDGALPRFRDKPLVVVGGGDSAVEEGTYLTKYASTVYIVHRRNELRASKIMQERGRSPGKRQGRRHRRASAQHRGRQQGRAGGQRCLSRHWPHSQYRLFGWPGRGRCQGLHRVDETAPDQHQRGRSIRRWRRGR
jgi:thioredoxin reductase (NADPH)